MNIQTRDFGSIQVEQDAVYAFPEGLYGFEDCIEFCVFSQDYDDISFLYLQSTEELDPCFLVFEPWDLYNNYVPILSEDDLCSLQVDSEDQLIFLVTATLKQNASDLSINLKSPIVLNPARRIGRQVILQNKEYPIRFHPFQQSGKDGETC